jgi:hypothetical protein
VDVIHVFRRGRRLFIGASLRNAAKDDKGKTGFAIMQGDIVGTWGADRKMLLDKSTAETAMKFRRLGLCAQPVWKTLWKTIGLTLP